MLSHTEMIKYWDTPCTCFVPPGSLDLLHRFGRLKAMALLIGYSTCFLTLDRGLGIPSMESDSQCPCPQLKLHFLFASLSNPVQITCMHTCSRVLPQHLHKPTQHACTQILPTTCLRDGGSHLHACPNAHTCIHSPTQPLKCSHRAGFSGHLPLR